MKPPSSSPNPATGPIYWRSLDQLADTPEFRQWLEREFPEGASEFSDPVSRRHFVKIMSASFLLAGLGLTGCRRPQERILPFSKMPENYLHGVPQYYATAMPTRASAIPLVAESNDARPTKVEGNALHPDSNGGTNLFAQASILNLYDPDRTQRFAKDRNTISRAVALDFLHSLSKRFTANQGQGLCVLLERTSSPSQARLQGEIQKKYPQSKWFVYEPVDLEAHSLVSSRLAGNPVRAVCKLDQAKVIVALDCDFIGGEEDTPRLIRGFAKSRRLRATTDSMSRLYVVESLMTLTGSSADHRLRLPSCAVQSVAAALAAELAPQNSAVKALAAKSPLPAAVKREWIVECAKDLAAHKGASIILAGHRQPPAVHALADLLNSTLQNSGKTILYQDRPEPPAGTLAELARALQTGQVDTLLILGSNPVYTAPVDLAWAETQRKAKTVVRLSYYEDETFAVSDWHLPAAHYLESWGDARTSDGTVVPIQPLIEPLFGGLTDLELLARVGGLDTVRPYDIVQETFRTLAAGDDFEAVWRKFLHDGFLAGSANPLAGALDFSAENMAAVLNEAAAAETPTKDSLEVVFHRDAKLDDGRYNNNGWLQELPDPITKVTWDDVILISRKTASDLGVQNGDLVEVTLGGHTIEGPIWVQPGLADNSLGLALGYGRQRAETGGTGRVGHGIGRYDAYRLRTSAQPHFAPGATLKKTGRTYLVASTQNHGSMEGRPIIREANLKDYRAHPGFAQNMDLDAHGSYIATDPKTGRPKKIYESPYRAYEERKSQSGVDLSQTVVKSEVHQWGMSIDLNACVGCAACVIACQSENNIPIVGKDQVSRDREMHWMRIARYYSGASDQAAPDQIDDPQVVNQPMLCQHCEDAPCESVCPVNATVHDEEGLNVMAYNRCVGTRYCSNNCPYKVRRFNFFDYNRHPLDRLYQTPLATGHDGKWNMVNWFKNPSRHHTLPGDQWELLKLLRNPDVSVRMRGVMEKCNFCVQRIEQAKITRKVKAGQSGDVAVPDGTFQTACQQACPAEAIVFGNLLDPQSRVSQLKKNERDYAVLGFLDNRPRTTYLARIRNPNPAMPDAYANPLNLQEYIDSQHTDPFAEQHGGGAGRHGAPSGAAQGPGQGGGH
jgi:MoCo/4Fe-4S cofactor protein with predicted Tat translocation signal